jgi:hypothetical protein
MPYADPKEQKEAMRRRYRERYESERGFRQKESRRKAKYYADNPKYRKRVIAKAKARKSVSKK